MARQDMTKIYALLGATLLAAVIIVVVASQRRGGEEVVLRPQPTPTVQQREALDPARPPEGLMVAEPGDGAAPAGGSDPAGAGASPGEAPPAGASNDANTTASAAAAAAAAAATGSGADGADAAGQPGGAMGSSAAGSDTARAGSDRPPGEELDENFVDESAAPEDAGPEAVTVGGEVLQGSRPVTVAQLQLFNSEGRVRQTRTRNEGLYRFEGVNPGTYTLVLQSPRSENSTRVLEIQAKVDRLGEDFVIPDTPRVRGVVLNAANGSPVPTAQIEVWRGDELRGAMPVDPEGRFTLMALSPGQYRLRGRATRYAEGEVAFQAAEAGESEEVRLLLEPTGTLKGIVRDPDGQPVPGAQVGLFGGAAFGDPFARFGNVFTDSTGRFEFTAPAAEMTSEFRVGAWHSVWIAAYSAPIQPASLPLADDVVVVMERGARISGRVVDGSEPEFAVPQASVVVQTGFARSGAIYTRFVRPYPNVTTGADGVFNLGPLEAGSITLRIAAASYVPMEGAWSVEGGATLDLGDIPLEVEEDTKPGRIFGVIMDERGSPMANHYLLVRHTGTNRDQSTYSDSQGGFTLDGLPDGDYMIAANGSALRGDQFMTMDQRYPFARPGEEKIYLIYDLSQSLRVKVTTQQGQPVTRFRIGIHNRTDGPAGFGGYRETFGQGMERDFQATDGTAIMENLLSGIVNVTITSEAYGTIERKGLRIPVGGQLDLGTVALEGGNTLEGRVISGQSGDSIAGTMVRMLAPEGSGSDHPLNSLRPRLSSDEGGRFVFKGVTAPDCDLLLEREGFVTRRVRNVTLSNRANNVGDVLMTVAAPLGGRVVSPEGEPIRNVLIRVGDATLFSDPEGRFFSNQAAAGEVTITFIDQSQSYIVDPVRLSLPPEGKTDLVITMTRRNLGGE